jgi:predicted RNA-binding Zn ribbon-like protein
MEDTRVDRRGRALPDGSWPRTRMADPQLEAVRRFLNTVNPETGADRLATLADLRDWFTEEGIGGAASFSSADRMELIEFREVLRALIALNRQHSGVTHEFDSVAIAQHELLQHLDGLAARRSFVLRFSEGPCLEGVGAASQRYVATLLATVFASMTDGTWKRLMSCSNQHCRWVVYDRSKNRSVTWCDEAACGSRSRSRSYRMRNSVGSTEESRDRSEEPATRKSVVS